MICIILVMLFSLDNIMKPNMNWYDGVHTLPSLNLLLQALSYSLHFWGLQENELIAPFYIVNTCCSK